MKRLKAGLLALLLWCILALFLQFVMQPHAPVPQKNYHAIAVVITPHRTSMSPTPWILTPTASTAISKFPMPTNYNASDIFDYYLWKHAPLRVDFPHTIQFTPNGPQSFIGANDYSTAGTPHWIIIAVFTDDTTAYQDYTVMQTHTNDTYALSSRCVLIEDAHMNISITQYYVNVLREGCQERP